MAQAIGLLSSGVGLVASGLGLLSFSLSHIPSNDPKGAAIQIKWGLGDDSSNELGGKIDAVYAFDHNDNYLGVSNGCSKEAGGVCTVTVHQGNPGIEANYISIANGNDASCLSWISVSQYDQGLRGAWNGDIGYYCGLPWYYGYQTAGTQPDGEPWYPRCAWFDGDHTNNYPYAALKFDVYAYGNLSSETLSKNLVCSASIFGADDGPINAAPQDTSKRSIQAKRSPPRLPWMEKRLIISNHAGHTAQDLCDSDTSFGPDLVGIDGNFCDMETKLVSPLCSKENVDGCVVVGQDGTVATKRSVARREIANEKTYEVVTEWAAKALGGEDLEK